MAAEHLESDEIQHEITADGPMPAPTPEYYGICSECMGDGQVPDPERPNHKEICGNCGGDGKSVRIKLES